MSNKVIRVRRAVVATLTIVGVILILTAVMTEVLGVDLTPGFGVLQTLSFLVGLTALTIAAYLFMGERRPTEAPRSLQAGIGIRLSLTGLVLCYVCGFADLIRIGTHVQPDFQRPFIGPLQLGGLVLGLLILIAGMLLYYTSRGKRPASSMEFLLNGKK